MTAANTPAWIGELTLRHLDAAYNLGRWLLGNDADASDAVHDAFLRATRSADSYAGGNARAWWLAIVRNCCLVRLNTRTKDQRNIAIDQNSVDAEHWLPRSEASEVEDRVDLAQRQSAIAQQLQILPAEFREVLILREIEELSYREIADVLRAPIGTVMSRLARGRAMLQKALAAPSARAAVETPHGL